MFNNNNNEDSMWGIGDENWRDNVSKELDIVCGDIVVSEYDIMLAVEKLQQEYDRGPTEDEIQEYILLLYGP